jgi:hypothetical protein
MRGTTFCAPMFDVSDWSWRLTTFSEISCKNGIRHTFYVRACEKNAFGIVSSARWLYLIGLVFHARPGLASPVLR